MVVACANPPDIIRQFIGRSSCSDLELLRQNSGIRVSNRRTAGREVFGGELWNRAVRTGQADEDVVSQDVPKGVDTVREADLLPLFVGSAVVADWNFVD